MPYKKRSTPQYFGQRLLAGGYLLRKNGSCNPPRFLHESLRINIVRLVVRFLSWEPSLALKPNIFTADLAFLCRLLRVNWVTVR